MKTFNRGKLQKLVKAGKVYSLSSYHFDDMTGEERREHCKLVHILPEDRSKAVMDGTALYLLPSDFKSKSGAAWQNENGSITLYVHSNCHYDLWVVPEELNLSDLYGNIADLERC